MIHIPSFVFPKGVPTQQDLLDCRTAGIVSPAISAYANKAAFEQPQNPLPPTVGRAKYWCNPNANKAKGTSIFSGDVTTGGALTGYMAATLSQTQRNFYTEFRNLKIPVWVYAPVTTEEWERLSFTEDDPRVPEEYPLGEVWVNEINPETGGWHIETNLPGNMIYFMLDERPCACGVMEAYRILRRS